MKNQEIIELFNNKSLKEKFISNYCGAQFSTNSKWTESQAEQQWIELFKLLSSAYSDNTLVPIYLAPKVDVIACLLYVSESGLSFRKEDNEIHLSLDYKNPSKPELKTILGYKGMARITMGTGFFKFFTTQLVMSGDTFSWQGQEERPVFISAGPSVDRKVVCGFVGFKYKDGDHLYIKVDGSELLEIERASLAYTAISKGSEETSLYLTPWRLRLLEIALWRIAYNRMREIVLFGSVRSQSKVDAEGNVMIAKEPDVEGFMAVFGEQKSA